MEINGDKLRELFTGVDERIALTNKQNEIKETPEEKSIKIENTKNIICAVVDLVQEVLSTANYRSGMINLSKRYRKHLGKISKGTNLTEKSNYIIDDDQLTIVLDYSNEYYGFIRMHGHGKCFINHDLREEKYYDARGNEILYEYMQHELRDAGIWLTHVYRETTTPDTVVEIQKVIIEVPREKEYTDEVKKLIK